jgi:hypothetical protein
MQRAVLVKRKESKVSKYLSYLAVANPPYSKRINAPLILVLVKMDWIIFQTETKKEIPERCC